MTITALDLFAGTGWGVAARWLGIREMGVEIMPEACATREANGMATIFHDVWEGLEGNLYVPEYQMLIASPPCQTFSLAGKGSGRKALDDVMEAIELHAYKDPARLREFGAKHDDRTALVLTPLAYIHRDRPRYVALEQVPTVLPVWEACAEVMREWGYSVWTGNLQAEQYGVPQTRKRAILMARLDGEVSPPVPTHSRYYSRDPKRMDEGVLPWVSMAEALGWDGFTAEKVMGRGMVERYGDRPGRNDAEPAFTVRASAGGMEPGGFVLRSNYGTGGDASKRGERLAEQPAPTMTSKADRNKWDGVRKMSIEEAATLQSYPTVFRNGNQANAAKRAPDQPAPTIHFGQRSNKVEWIDADLASDPAASGERVTTEQASILQSFPDDPPFVWRGTKSKQFLQIGNAVPPLLAKAVLSALIQPVVSNA